MPPATLCIWRGRRPDGHSAHGQRLDLERPCRPHGAELTSGGIRVGAKYRYRQKDQAATLTRGADGQMLLTFDEPQRAIAPGQAVVIYARRRLGWRHRYGSYQVAAGLSPHVSKHFNSGIHLDNATLQAAANGLESTLRRRPLALRKNLDRFINKSVEPR